MKIAPKSGTELYSINILGLTSQGHNLPNMPGNQGSTDRGTEQN